MDTIIALAAFFLSLVFCLYSKISIVYALLAGLAAFLLAAHRRGHSWASLFGMSVKGAKKSLLVLEIFLLIGAITAVWRASGTIPFIVYHAIDLLNAKYFIPTAFLLSCGVSFLLGTSLGTASTIGVVLIVLAKSGGVDVAVTAGAVIAGAYFGDRGSPMSSSANLVAALTGTNLYTNIKNMFLSGLVPFILSVAGFAYLAGAHRLSFQGSAMGQELARYFDISPVAAVPAVIILLLVTLRVDVKLAMLLSLAAGFFIAIFVQHVPVGRMLEFIVYGFKMQEGGFLAGIIKGGGLLSMLNVALIVLISSTYAGIFEGTGLLRDIERMFAALAKKIGNYPAIVAGSFVTAAFSCNQTLAAMLTYQLFYKIYRKERLDSYKLALDIENSVIVISPLVPWNIAGAALAAAMAADSGFIPYALYLWLIPACHLFLCIFKMTCTK